jgi:kynurenine formamidase
VTDPTLEFRERLRGLRRWSRWGDDDQRGALNLLTPERVRAAAALVRLGETCSLSRPWPVYPGPDNPEPANHFISPGTAPGTQVDYLSAKPHGRAMTHLDGLCHVWNADGMWNGRDPARDAPLAGPRWAGIENWRDGIVTRGVLLDVASRRPRGFVEDSQPVTGDELSEVAAANGIESRPGDAVIIHSGREAWTAAHDLPWGAERPGESYARPGLSSSCLEFLHDWDPSIVVWDMMDAVPSDCGVPHPVHTIIFIQGVGLLDNALIEPLARRCAELNRTDFMFCVAPLVIPGGTGSPVNPLAIL